MLNRDTTAQLDTTAAMLLRLVDELHEAGDRDGALAASDAADAMLVLLDLHVLKDRAWA